MDDVVVNHNLMHKEVELLRLLRMGWVVGDGWVTLNGVSKE